MSFGILRDEFGGHVQASYGDRRRYGRFEERPGLSDVVAAKSLTYRALSACNVRYSAFFDAVGGLDAGLASVYVGHPDDIKDFQVDALLEKLCRNDILMAKRYANYCRYMAGLFVRYQVEFDEIQRTVRTPESLIPDGIDYSEFYAVESRLLNHLRIDRGPRRPLHGRIRFEWSTTRAYERDHPGCGFAHVCPPSADTHVSFHVRQLDAAIFRAEGRGRSFYVSDAGFELAIAAANGVCPLCGRPVSECGPLGVYSLDDTCFYTESVGWHIGDDDSLCVMCAECRYGWIGFFGPEAHFLAHRPRFLENPDSPDDGVQEYIRCETDEERVAFARRYIQSLRDASLYDVDVFVPDSVKAMCWPAGRVRRQHVMDSVGSFLEGLGPKFRRKTEDYCVPAACRNKFTALEVLSLEFEDKARDVPYIYEFEAMCPVSDKRPDGAYVNFRLFAEAYPDVVRGLAMQVKENRVLATLYEKCYFELLGRFRTVLKSDEYESEYEAHRKLYHNVQTECFFRYVGLDGKASWCVCSIETMCIAAGLGPILGECKKSDYIRCNRVLDLSGK